MRSSRSPATGSTSSSCSRPRGVLELRADAAESRCRPTLRRRPSRSARARSASKATMPGPRPPSTGSSIARPPRPMPRPDRRSRAWSRRMSREPSGTASRPSAASRARSPSGSSPDGARRRSMRRSTRCPRSWPSAGIAKSRFNQADDYKYRSIDDVLDRLAPLLAKHRLCVLPRVRERQTTERSGDDPAAADPCRAAGHVHAGQCRRWLEP